MFRKYLSIVLCLIMIIGQFNFVYAADIEDNYRRITQKTPDGFEINKPTANFKVTVKKPDGNKRYTEPTEPETGKDLAYDEFGNVRDMSLIPVITAYVGDTLKFEDDSDTGSGNLEICEFQWYSGQESGGLYKASIGSFENKTFTLTEPGYWKLYYQVMDDCPAPLLPNWSDNGCHVTRAYNNPDFLPAGLLWYYTRVDVEVLSEPDPIPDFKITYNGTDVTNKNFEITSFPCTVTLTDTSATDDGAKIDSREWKTFDNAGLSYQAIESTEPTINYIITADQVSSVSPKYFLLTLNGKSSLKVSHFTRPYLKEAPPDDDVPEPPEEPEDPDPNISPVAIIDAPDEVRIGEEFEFSGLGSYDEDGEIVEYTMSDQSACISSADDGYRVIWYETKGQRTLRLAVKDNRGARANTTQRIDVIDPFVYARISCNGALKENRKVDIIDDSDTPERYPIKPTQTQWTITPISGGTEEDIKYTGNLKGVSSKQVLFKKAGQYKITLSVINTAGFTDTAERIITIAPDQAPKADFTIAASSLRNPDKGKQAQIKLTDKSYSPDNDIISQRTWYYAYDSDNDGIFTDETWVTLDTGNNASPVLTVSDIGKYKFELSVKESFGQPTIEEFITSTDYKSANTASKVETTKLCEVLNVAPSSEFNVYHRKKVDLQILVDDDIAPELKSNIALLNKKLLENHIQANIKIDTVENEGIGNSKKLRTTTELGNFNIPYSNGSVTNGYANGDMFDISNGIRIQDHTGFYNAHIPGDFIESNQYNRFKSFCNKSGTEMYMINIGAFGGKYSNYNLTYYSFDMYNNKILSQKTVTLSPPSDWKERDFLGMRYVYSFYEDNKVNVIVSLGREMRVDEHYNLYLVTFDATSGNILKNTLIYNGCYMDDYWFLDETSCSYESSQKYNGSYGLFLGVSSDKNTYYTNKPHTSSGGYIREYQMGTNYLVKETRYNGQEIDSIDPIYGTNTKDRVQYLCQYEDSSLSFQFDYVEFNTSTGDFKSLNCGSRQEFQTLDIDYERDTYSSTYNSKYIIRSLSDVSITKGISVDYCGYFDRSPGNTDTYAFGYDFIDDYTLVYISYNNDRDPGTSGSYYLLFKDGEYIDKYRLSRGIQKYGNKGWGYTVSPDDGSSNTISIFDNVLPRAGVLYDKLSLHDPEPGIPSFRVAMINKDLYPEGAYPVSRTINNSKLNMLLMTGDDSEKVQEFKTILSSRSTITNATLSEDLNANINTIANYIINRNQSEKVSTYVILNEPLDYETFYSDYEADPQHSGHWKFTHTDPYCFDNGLGILANQGIYLTDPIVSFNKVGRITATHQVQDNPKDAAPFDNYKLWSAEKNIEFIVHRRPIAEFSLTVRPDTGNYIPVISDTSYDLDHTSRADKGIVSRKWSWMESGSNTWTNGLPTAFAANESYVVQLQVQDLEGAWSTPIHKTIDTGSVNLPPLVDANPRTGDSDENITVTITADDLGEGDFDHTNYYWSKYTRKPGGTWTTKKAKTFTTTLITEGTWYLHMEAYDSSGQSFYIYRGPYIVKKLPPPPPPVDMSASLVPNPALSGDEIIFTVNTVGYVDKVVIFVDQDIVKKDNRTDKYSYPLVFNVNGGINQKTNILRYITCVETEQTLTKDNVRRRQPYNFIVRASRGEIYREVELTLDVRRSVLELLHPGVKTN